ncbi:tetraacyldisaccharide 4'-kinase [Hahella sp. CCB-MM4]|uniref:tetraacyldisaccharide 4'-kinase n=1 Tax=Hahella sp. (strain CCB-MM4) TaxID=1926491 RepID=UPI000B9B6700|nr:tetraacyldisaccharide 4'-kinase [Hahella sp. CCB-MM4]OZG73455.1 tetraacyldisaccharide 4'-kinase [Hahella sp. CCB-MM4]
MTRFIERVWYGKNLWWLLFLPLTFVYMSVVLFRKGYYRLIRGDKAVSDVPVIVVGNVTVGGTGKTPLVMALVGYLESIGYRPGVISRGYGGNASVYPHVVEPEDSPAVSGDEPLLIRRRAGVPVVVDPNRTAALGCLLDKFHCNVVISDDGLQHLKLPRDMEIVVIDGARGLGNRWCLPSGPMRESAERLKNVDFVIANGKAGLPVDYEMTLKPTRLVAVNGDEVQATELFAGRTVHAVAGIGNPERFFSTLEALGMKVVRHAFPDHHVYQADDLVFEDGFPVVMTEKDAVKCGAFKVKELWYLEVEGGLSKAFFGQVGQRLQEISSSR